MKHKVSELSGDLLDAAVARAEGWTLERHEFGGSWWLKPGRMPVGISAIDIKSAELGPLPWSTDWLHGGPIIQREGIGIMTPNMNPGEPGTWWEARSRLIPVTGPHMAPCYRMDGPTPLIAAMRAYVASKLGEEVELP